MCAWRGVHVQSCSEHVSLILPRRPARPACLQWMRTAEWQLQDDAMLLLGAWRHGINAWER